MRQTVLIVIVAAVLTVGCQRKDKVPKPIISAILVGQVIL